MKSLSINIHSFLDIITNSSSETFISADESTLKAIQNLVDNILKGSGSEFTSDSLFNFEMEYESANSENELGMRVRVSVKDNPSNRIDPKALKLASKTLSSLQDLFIVTAQYD